MIKYIPTNYIDSIEKAMLLIQQAMEINIQETKFLTGDEQPKSVANIILNDAWNMLNKLK